MTLIDKAEALRVAQEASDNSDSPQDVVAAIAALPARVVGVKPEAAETLAKEMQAIVAADRWKGRDLSAAPPEKWSHLRPETQQFWIDTATRILAALDMTNLQKLQIAALAPTDATQAREAALSIAQAAQVLFDAMTARPQVADPFDPCDLEIERLAIEYSGQGGDAVIVLETAEKFMLAGLRALIGETRT